MIARKKWTKSFGTESPYLPVSPPARVEARMCCRILRKGGGKFLYLTFGQPHFRRRYLTRPDTTLEIQQIGDAFHYYLYILRS